MDFQDVIRKRRMVRNFADTPVDPEIITRIIDASRHAPSAGFTQGQSFIVITDPATRTAIAQASGEPAYLQLGFDPFVSKAPILLIPCTSEAAYRRRYAESDKARADGNEVDWPIPFWYMDIGCAVMLVLLAVVDEGLAAGYVSIHDFEAVRRILNIPDDVTPVGVIPIGHPLPDKRSPSLKRGRKADADYVHYEQW